MGCGGTSGEDAARAALKGAEAAARAAFADLEPAARAFLRSYLRRELSPDAAEDVAQEVLTRVWTSRAGYRDQGRASWYAFLKRIADRCRVDHFRSAGAAAVSWDDVPDEDLADLDRLFAVAETGDGAAECLRQADLLWLGLDPTLTQREHDRRLLAAQWFYLDGAGCPEIAAMLNGDPSAPSVTRAQLDQEWLTDGPGLRRLAYRELYLDNERLAAALLERPDGGWSPAETTVLMWRIRHGLSLDQIAARADCPLPSEELSRLADRLTAAFPFKEQMCALAGSVLERGEVDAAGPLGSIGLWQRLAFQYRYLDDLTHRDLHDRTAPPASVVGVDLNLGMLNMWLSGGRLLRRLARRMAGEDR